MTKLLIEIPDELSRELKRIIMPYGLQKDLIPRLIREFVKDKELQKRLLLNAHQ